MSGGGFYEYWKRSTVPTTMPWPRFMRDWQTRPGLVCAGTNSWQGQRGKRWQTGKGKNIAMSLVLEPERFGRLSLLLSASIALACHAFFSKNTLALLPGSNGPMISIGVTGRQVVYLSKMYTMAKTGNGPLQARVSTSTKTGSTRNSSNPVSLYQITGTQHNVPGPCSRTACTAYGVAARLGRGNSGNHGTV